MEYLTVLKLIIVDDEKTTREGLLEYIPWKELGIEVVEDAEDGVKALELAMRIQPDIILCDVRMPRMNGIELAARIKESLPECKIIFLSGYSDKEYLKSAIQLKAFSYVEKPIDMEEIKNTVQNAVSICMEEKGKKRIEGEMKSKLNESIHLVKQKLALELLNSSVNTETLWEKFDSAGLDFPADGDFITIILKLNVYERISIAEQEHYNNLIFKTLEEKFNEISVNYLLCCNNEHMIIHIHDKKIENSHITQVIPDILQKSVRGILQNKCTLSIGVGKRIHGVKNILQSYQTALTAVRKQFFRGYDSIIFYEDKKMDSYDFSEEISVQFVEYLKEDKKEEAVSLIKKISDNMRQHDNTDINYIKNIFFNLLLQLYKIAEERDIHITGQGNEKKFLWEIISNLQTLQEIKEHIIDKISTVFQQIEEKDTKSKAVFEAMKYIQKNYPDENLSIKSIADYTYLTPTYLCLIFKKETGKTINQYITEIRIGKSKEYLKDRKIKLYEIANKIGYSNANYFAKIFKKVVGSTPSEFRECYLS